jgi:phage baseplate assembly protein W
MTAEAQRDPGFLGRGWRFPPAFDGGDSGDGVATVEAAEDVHESILIILGTNHGERPMRPEFGANLNALAFEPIGAVTAALVRHRVEEALVLWEPRIDHVRVNVTSNRDTPTTLLVDIDYRVRTTNVFYNLVYPFYLLEGATR